MSQTLPAYPQIRETLILIVQSIKLGLEIIVIYPFYLGCRRNYKKLKKSNSTNLSHITLLSYLTYVFINVI